MRPLEHLDVVFSDDMIGDPWRAAAVGPVKGREVAEALRGSNLRVNWVAPEPATREDLYRAHEPRFVDDVLDCRRPSAFGTLSDDLARSLRYTCGAVYTSALRAQLNGVSASLTCGFHHAQYDQPRSFCTFNGLIVACLRLLAEQQARRILILDCDYHYGDGTDALIQRHALQGRVLNISFGRHFYERRHAEAYLRELRNLKTTLSGFCPDIILYQAGVDVHVDDPLGGLLTTSEICERDRMVFDYAHGSETPIAWNLAGGYQVEPDGTFLKTTALHMSTFRAAAELFMREPHVAAL